MSISSEPRGHFDFLEIPKQLFGQLVSLFFSSRWIDEVIVNYGIIVRRRKVVLFEVRVEYSNIVLHLSAILLEIGFL